MSVRIIKKLDGRIDRVTGTKIEHRLRVTAYCRVSTDGEEQLHSYQSQLAYYREKITSNPEWDFVEIYADEAISGTQDYKRNEFMRMIQDALAEKFDMIMTKSISRFARNTVDTLKYVRLLKEHNVAVFFEKENINTLEMSGELLLTILSSVAQQDSETISSNVKLGIKMKRERGEITGFNNCLGYRYNGKDKAMIIIEDEAEIVRFIFKKYCEGYGASTIANELTKLGYKTPKGNEKWSESTIRGIIRNEKYKGDVLMGKTFTLDPISHKRLINMGEEDKYYIENNHEPIIDAGTFEIANNILNKRRGAREAGRRKGNYSRKYTFSSKLVCGFCGEVLSRRSLYVGKQIYKEAWLCMKSAKFGKYHCPESKVIREEVIENCFVDAYKLLCVNNKFVVETFLKRVQNVLRDNTATKQYEKIGNQIKSTEEKISKLLDMVIDGKIDNKSYNLKKENLEEKVYKLKEKQEQYKLLMEDEESIENGLNKFRTVFDNNELIVKFDKEVFDALVEYVVIGGKDENGIDDPYMIRFICKTDLRSRSSTEIKEIEKSKAVLRAMIDEENPIILEFMSNQSFMRFDKDELGRLKKQIVNRIKVVVEFNVNTVEKE